jgi:hypothetical protein
MRNLVAALALLTIPIAIYDNLPLAPVHIGSAPLLWFVPDSAAKTTYIDTARARAAGLAAGKPAILSLSRSTLTIPRLSTTELASLQRTEGHAIDGVLGAELFRKYVVQIDYDTRVLRLFDPSTFTPDAGAESVPLFIKDDKAYVHCAITMPGVVERDELFLVNPSSGGALSHPAFARSDVPANTPPRDLGRATRFRIGSFAFDGVNGVSAPPSIGGEILHRFTVTFDYSRSTLWLEAGRHFGDAWMFDMSGLDLAWNATRTQIDVVHVFEQTPGQEAGLRAGDVIVAIDNQRIAAFDLDQVVKMLHLARTYTLDVRRGTRRMKISMTLRRLL